MLTLILGRYHGLSSAAENAINNSLRALPESLDAVMELEDQIIAMAEDFDQKEHALFLGRGMHYPVAMEGALKLKEISYIHAEGYPAAEMKHGPIALIDENMPVVFIAPQDESFPKILANIEEVKARKGIIITITDKINNSLKLLSDHTLVIPKTHKHVFPITCSVVLQILAYELALCRDCEIDQPRNLAKSVTVE